MELSKSENLNAAVAFETVNLCGFDVPVFRGAQPIPQELIDKLKTPLPQDAIKENSDPKKKGMSSIKSILHHGTTERGFWPRAVDTGG